MKVILNNGVEVTPIIVTGEKRNIQNARRDVLTFVFGETSLDEIDGIFTTENCEKMVIVGNDNSEAIYKGYVVRAELVKEMVEVKGATAEESAEYETRVKVSMAERTYAETQLANLTEVVDVLLLENLLA